MCRKINQYVIYIYFFFQTLRVFHVLLEHFLSSCSRSTVRSGCKRRGGGDTFKDDSPDADKPCAQGVQGRLRFDYPQVSKFSNTRQLKRSQANGGGLRLS